MRKFYSIILMSVVALLGFNTSAVTFKVVVDDPARVRISFNYSEVTEVLAENEFTFEEGYPQLVISATDGNMLEKVVCSNGAYSQVYNGQCSMYPNTSEWDGCVVTVTSYNLSERRTATCTVNIDDPSKISAFQLNSTYETISLNVGANTVKFIPDVESPLILRIPSGSTIYSVKVDGYTVTKGQYDDFYSLKVQDGSVVDIQANYPDIDYKVTIVENEGAEGFISRVVADGVDVTDWSSFDVKAGKKVTVYGDVNRYSFKGMSLNGTVIASYMYSDGASFIVTEDSHVEVNAAKYQMVSAFVTVDTPENVTVKLGSGSPFNLTGGEKYEFEFTSGSYTYLYVTANDGAMIVSVKQNGTDVTSSANYGIRVSENDEFVIETAKIVRDKKAVFYIYKSATPDYLGVYKEINTNRTEITQSLVDGYNIYEFYEGDNPFGISYYSQAGLELKAYLNDEDAPMSYGNYTMSLVDGDVVKIFIGEEPAKSNVTFTIAEGIEAPAVKRDHVKEVDVNAQHTVHNGTIFHIIGDDSDYSVKVNRESLASDNGQFEFLTSGDTNVEIAKKNSGVENVTVSSKASGAVYNLQGIKVADSADQIDNLPAGIYVTDGKKVSVK